jgi:hypothetical protein
LLSSGGHKAESVLASDQFDFRVDFAQDVSVLVAYIRVYASDHVYFVAFGRKHLSRGQSRISVRRIGRQRVRLVHFAGFVLAEQGGRQLRRFRIDAVTQQRLDVRPVRVRIHRACYQGAVQRHVHLGKQAVMEITDGSDRICRIQVVAVDSGNLRSHAQKTVGLIQIIVAGGDRVEFDGCSARYVRYWVIIDVNSAFDTRWHRRQREEI